MTAVRRLGRLGDGSAVTRGWTALITLGLPAPMRDRRRGEVAADLDEETIDAVRRHTPGHPPATAPRSTHPRHPRRHRLAVRRCAGDGPAISRRRPRGSRSTAGARSCSAVVAIGATGGLTLVGIPLLTGQLGRDDVARLGSGRLHDRLPRHPRRDPASPSRGRGRAVTAILPALLIGFAAAPWLWGCWILAAMAVGLRVYQSSSASS